MNNILRKWLGGGQIYVYLSRGGEEKKNQLENNAPIGLANKSYEILPRVLSVRWYYQV